MKKTSPPRPPSPLPFDTAAPTQGRRGEGGEKWSTVYRVHATLRMAERDIGRLEVENTLAYGEPIELYDNDRPYPSRLLLGGTAERPLHVVAAWNKEAREWIVITVYEPNLEEWNEGFKTRRSR